MSTKNNRFVGCKFFSTRILLWGQNQLAVRNFDASKVYFKPGMNAIKYIVHQVHYGPDIFQLFCSAGPEQHQIILFVFYAQTTGYENCNFFVIFLVVQAPQSPSFIECTGTWGESGSICINFPNLIAFENHLNMPNVVTSPVHFSSEPSARALIQGPLFTLGFSFGALRFHALCAGYAQSTPQE